MDTRVCIACCETKIVGEFKKSKYVNNKCRSCTSQHDIKVRKQNLLANGIPLVKHCFRCNQQLEASAFGKSCSNSDGLQSYCKGCTSSYTKERRAGIKRKQAEHPHTIATCRCCLIEKSIKDFSAGSSFRCKTCVADYMRRKLATDIHLRIRSQMRCRHWYALKRGKTLTANRRTEDDVGCSMEELKEHLERQFKPGMTWDNWGRRPDQWGESVALPLARCQQ